MNDFDGLGLETDVGCEECINRKGNPLTKPQQKSRKIGATKGYETMPEQRPFSINVGGHSIPIVAIILTLAVVGLAVYTTVGKGK